MWIVKLYEVCPKSISYLGDEEWVATQKLAKRFASASLAHHAAYSHNGAVVVKLKPRSNISEFPLTLSFDSAELRNMFRGWLSDGGGEQSFMSIVTNERGTSLDIDYDSETLVVVNEHRG